MCLKIQKSFNQTEKRHRLPWPDSTPQTLEYRMLKLEILTSYPELETVRDFWSCHVVYPTADFELFLHICQSRKDVIEPYVLAIKNNDQVVALLIGRIEFNRRTLRLGYLKTKGPALRCLTFIHGGNLGDWGLDNTSQTLREILYFLKRKQIDLVNFAYLPEDAVLIGALKELLKANRHPYLFSLPQTHWEMKLDHSGQEFLNHLSRKSRYNLRRERRKFEEEFQNSITFRHFQEPEDIKSCIADLEHIAAQSYHRSLGVGFEATEETVQRMTLEAQRGRLLVYILYIHETPVAFWIGVLLKQVFFTDYTGYLTTYAEHEPGKNTLFSMIEFLTNKTNAHSIDFGLGDAFYKRQLGSNNWKETSVVVYGHTAKAYFTCFLERALAFVESRLRHIATRTNTLGKIKTLWRRYLRTRANNRN